MSRPGELMQEILYEMWSRGEGAVGFLNPKVEQALKDLVAESGEMGKRMKGSDFQMEMPEIVEIDTTNLWRYLLGRPGHHSTIFTVPKGKSALVRREGTRLVIEIGKAKETASSD